MITSPYCQSTLGLWAFSQVNPRIKSCLPKLDIVSKTCSKWVSYWNTMFTTSDIYPTSFGMPLTLYTDIDLKSLWVLRLCFSTKLGLIKTLIAPELTRACIEKDLEMPIVLREIKRYRKILWTLLWILRALMVEYRGSFFSYLGQWEGELW